MSMLRRSLAEQRRILSQDALVQAPQLRRRIDAKLRAQRRAAGVVHPQRLGLLAGPVQRQHQLATQLLVEGVSLDEVVEPRGRHDAARRELGLHQRRLRLQTPGAQDGTHEISQWLSCHVREGLAPPEIECGPEGVHRGVRVTSGQLPASPVAEPLEAVDVDRLLRDGQDISSGRRDHGGGAAIERVGCQRAS